MIRLVLVETEGAVNLGFIARLVENFDVDELFLVSPRASLQEAERYAARAAWRLHTAKIVSRLDDALQGATLRACTSAHRSKGDDVLRVAMSPWELAKRAIGEPLTAVVMGRESTGLTRGELDRCDVLVNIPTSDKYRALNLSNATAIILYEIYKARMHSKWRPRELPDEHHLQLLYRYFSDVTSKVAESREEKILRAFKNILARAGASREEVDALLFLFSRIARRVV